MNPTWAPQDVPAATRGEFLALRDTAVRELERRILSPAQVLLHGGLAFVASLFWWAAGGVLAEPGNRTVLVVITVVLTGVGLAAVVPTVRRAVRNRKLTPLLLAWETAERQARSLPPGEVRPDLRTPFDARGDADFEHVAALADGAAYSRPTDGRLMFRLVPPSLGLAWGFVLVMGVSRDAPVLERVGWGVAGGYLLLCCVVAIAATMRLSWRLTRVWRAQKTDIAMWRAERIGPVAAAEVDRAWRRKRWLIVAPFMGLSVLGLAARVMTSSPAAVALAVAVVVLAGLIVGIVLLVRSRATARRAEGELTSAPPG